MIRSYSDESQRPGSPLVSIAWCLMTDSQYMTLDLCRKASLGDLPCFHMREGHHIQNPTIYSALLDCITPDHAIAGSHVVVDEDKYRQATDVKLQGQTLRYWFGGAYTFCLNA